MVDCSRLFDNDLPDGSVLSQVSCYVSCTVSPHNALLMLESSIIIELQFDLVYF